MQLKYEIVTEATKADLEAFIQNHPKGHFIQSTYWAKQKPDWKWQAILCRDESGAVQGAASVLVRKVPMLPYTLMYCGRGPVCDLENAEVVGVLMDGLKELAKKNKSYCITCDPDILLSESEETTKIMAANGFRRKDSGKNFDGAQPRFVFRLQIEGKTEDEVFAQFHSKTRYNIRVAKKHDVQIEIKGKEATEDFYRIMVETGSRDNFSVRPKAYFDNMLDNLGDHARLYMAYHEGKPIAGTLAILYGDKVWYLYGASSNSYRNLMPNYLLQWSMIQWAIEEKCRLYDFRGVSGDLSEDNPLYGLYRFKKGFNGDFCEFVGEYEYIPNPMMYKLVTKGIKTLKKIRKKLG